MEELQKNLIITYYKQNVDTRVNNIAAFIKIASFNRVFNNID